MKVMAFVEEPAPQFGCHVSYDALSLVIADPIGKVMKPGRSSPATCPVCNGSSPVTSENPETIPSSMLDATSERPRFQRR